MRLLIFLIIIFLLVYFFLFIDSDVYENRHIASEQIEEVEENTPKGCLEELTEKIEEESIDYEKGSILVAYEDDVSLDEAIDVLIENDISWIESDEEEEHFSERGWLTASVERGDELNMICNLKDYEGVRNATLNVLFELHT